MSEEIGSLRLVYRIEALLLGLREKSATLPCLGRDDVGRSFKCFCFYYPQNKWVNSFHIASLCESILLAIVFTNF